MPREVTERDFRMPEFRDAKVEDYEFRGDGKLVRKDRWESAIGTIRDLVGVNRREFEIPDVVEAVRQMAEQFEDWLTVQPDSTDPDDWPPADTLLDLKLDDDSVLRGALYDRKTKVWSWRGPAPMLPVKAWREQKPVFPLQDSE